MSGPCPLDSLLFELDVHLPPPSSDAAMPTFASLSRASLLSQIPAADKTALVSRLITECPRSPVAKAVGSMVALAAADATGHWFEFMDACDKPGENSLNPAFVENLQQWDDGDVAVRAYMLHFMGQKLAMMEPETEAW